MHPWTQVVLLGCALTLTGAAVALLLAVRRTAQRADTVLRIVEEELRPLIGQAHALTDEVRALTREANLEMKRVGEATERVNNIAEGVGRVMTAFAGFTRAGQLIGIAASLKRGVDRFRHRRSKV
jgi:uncharacterized protein YoxC